MTIHLNLDVVFKAAVLVAVAVLAYGVYENSESVDSLAWAMMQFHTELDSGIGGTWR